MNTIHLITKTVKHVTIPLLAYEDENQAKAERSRLACEEPGKFVMYSVVPVKLVKK